jgi:predicted oxidoreductase
LGFHPKTAGFTVRPHMKTLRLGRSALVASRLAYGCWRLAGSEGQPPEPTSAVGIRAVHAAADAGYTMFDLADIYGGGRCEEIFGEALRAAPELRARILIASKCGIRRAGEPAGTPVRYDFNTEYIVTSVEGSLRRLGIETLDLLMLHRPDYLMDPHTVAGAFVQLRDAGKVREFGVSNFRPSQVTALQRLCPLPLAVNQVELSLLQLAALEDGTLDQCLAETITPMAWSPLAGGLLGSHVHGLLPGQRGYEPTRVNTMLDRLAGALGATREAVALAWLLRHPAGIQPVVGSTDPARIRAAAAADALNLSHADWYHLVTAARTTPLP